MAIRLTRVLDSGFEANYWRVISVHLDADTKMIGGAVALYKDGKARRAGSSPVSTVLFNFEADVITGNLVSLVYDHLKQTELTGGEDE